MALSDDEVELLELPEEFEGLPYHTKRRAFGVAESQLPLAAIVAALGTAVAETALVEAAAHYLATTGDPNAQPSDLPSPRRGHQVGEDGTRGLWAGSPHGDAVSKILDRLEGGGSSGRRCSHSYPVPAP